MPANLNLDKWLKIKIITIQIIIIIIITTHLFFFSGSTLHSPMYTLTSPAMYRKGLEVLN